MKIKEIINKIFYYTPEKMPITKILKRKTEINPFDYEYCCEFKNKKIGKLNRYSFIVLRDLEQVKEEIKKGNYKVRKIDLTIFKKDPVTEILFDIEGERNE